MRDGTAHGASTWSPACQLENEPMLRRRRYAQEANVDTAVDGRDYAVAALSVPAAVVAALAPAKAAAADKFSNKLYIVRLAEKPVVAYDGGIKGLQATRPGKGQKIDPNSPRVVDYKALPRIAPDAVLASVGGGKKLYSYGYVFNGFAAELTEAQAAKLAATPGVPVGQQGRAARSSTPRRRRRSSASPRRAASGTRRRHRQRRRGRHHRHRRQRRLARAPELLRPHRHQRQRHARTASWTTSRSRAGTAGASRARSSTPRTATRS